MSRDHTTHIVRTKINQLLSGSGLLEYGCRSPQCETQIFTTWEIDVTCHRCGQPVVSKYFLD